MPSLSLTSARQELQEGAKRLFVEGHQLLGLHPKASEGYVAHRVHARQQRPASEAARHEVGVGPAGGRRPTDLDVDASTRHLGATWSENAPGHPDATQQAVGAAPVLVQQGLPAGPEHLTASGHKERGSIVRRDTPCGLSERGGKHEKAMKNTHKKQQQTMIFWSPWVLRVARRTK